MEDQLSLKYLVRYPKKELKNPPVIILLHGYGSNEQDLFSFSQELPDELMIISARAPLTLGNGSYSWYTISYDMNNGKFSDTDEAISSRELINTFIDEIVTFYDVDKENVFLLGFSQGAILSYATALCYPEKVKNIVALSGYIDKSIIPEDLTSKNYNHLDFFISHGTVDQVIPIEWAQNSAPLLHEFNISNSYQEYIVGHGVSPQNFHDFNNWIKKRI